MQPYSIETARPQPDRIVPANHTSRVNPMLPADLTIEPGVAKIPLPITRDTTKIYALDQLRFFLYVAPGNVSGNGVSSSSDEILTGSWKRLCGTVLYWVDGSKRGCCSWVPIVMYDGK